MHYRELGSTGLKVSEISMGCNRLGQPSMPDEHWVKVALRAVDLGVNLFDTAARYAGGRSEVILGKAVGNRDDVYIATKVSRMGTGTRDFGSEYIYASVETSLRSLQRDCIDILQLHSPSLDDLKRFDWAEAMTKLKEQGKIRFAGVSINDAPSGRWLIENSLVQQLQVAYNMIDPQVGQDVFPLAEAQGVGILVRMPMARGILTGKFASVQDVDSDSRANLNRDRVPGMIEKAEAIRDMAQRAGITMGQFALRHSITPVGVSAAIPGARTIEQLEQNVAASNGVGLSDTEMAEIAAIQGAW